MRLLYEDPKSQPGNRQFIAEDFHGTPTDLFGLYAQQTCDYLQIPVQDFSVLSFRYTEPGADPNIGYRTVQSLLVVNGDPQYPGPFYLAFSTDNGEIHPSAGGHMRKPGPLGYAEHSYQYKENDKIITEYKTVLRPPETLVREGEEELRIAATQTPFNMPYHLRIGGDYGFKNVTWTPVAIVEVAKRCRENYLMFLSLICLNFKYDNVQVTLDKSEMGKIIRLSSVDDYYGQVHRLNYYPSFSLLAFMEYFQQQRGVDLI